MPVEGISNGNGAVALDRQSFGAQVVTRTLDTLNGASPSAPAPVGRQGFGAAVVAGTLDALNVNQAGGKGAAQTASDFDMQKKVLGAHATGAVFDTTT